MQDAQVVAGIRRKYRRLAAALNERSRRLWAANEAMELGWGGVTAVARATKLSPTTILTGIGELKEPRRAALPPERIRQPDGGRKRAVACDPSLQSTLEALVEPTSRGDPEAPLRWTIKSTRVLAAELVRQKHPVSYHTVGALLNEAGYSLQANRKTREGGQHPDRNAQFEYINAQVQRFPEARPAGDLGGHEKEGIGRGFQERRPGMASAGRTRKKFASTTSRTRTWARPSRTACMTAQQPRLGQRGHRP